MSSLTYDHPCLHINDYSASLMNDGVNYAGMLKLANHLGHLRLEVLSVQ